MKECIVKPLFEDMYFRNESEKYMLVVPKKGSYNDAMMVNFIGKLIIDYLGEGSCSISSLADYISAKYPEVDKTIVLKDVSVFVEQLRKMNIVKLEGNENMYKGKFIFGNREAGVYRCSEGDTTEVYKALDEKFSIEYIEPAMSDLHYNRINVRAKIIGFMEEYYIFYSEGKIKGVVSYLDGKTLKNNTPHIGTIRAFDKESVEVLLRESLKDYADSFCNGCKKIRINAITSSDYYEILNELLHKEGFITDFVLKNEYGENQDMAICTKWLV